MGKGSEEMNRVVISTEYIRLDQAMKFANAVESGAFAKEEIISGMVKVNGSVELRRGKKLYDGDSFEYDGETYVIEGKDR